MRYLYYSIFFFSLFQCSYSQGSVLLVGGGSENYADWSDIPYGWLVNHAPNKKILILHYSTVSTFLPDYFKSLGASQAVSTTISSAAANDSATYRMILEYDGIFLRGGDQWEYVKQWKGTLTEEAITKVFQRGGAIGGTSAGAMVLSKFIADAGTTSVDPRTAIRTPLSAGITFTDDFLGFVPGILCDTHFYERGRLARLLAMQGVQYKNSGSWFTGVGIDDATALGVSSDGSAEVFGSGVVSVLVPKVNTAASVKAGKPLGLSDITLRQYTKGAIVQLPAGTNISASNMSAYQAAAYSTVHKNVILDGSSSTADWSGTTGSLNAFVNRAGNDTVEILTSSPANIQISDVRSFLSARNVPSSVTIVSPFQRQTDDVVKIIASRNSFLLAIIAPDSLPFLADSLSVTGFAFRNMTGKNILLLGDAASFAGMQFVNKLEVTTTAAYRGRLTIENGLGLVKGLMIIPRLYESDSYLENRACALPWGIGKTQPSFGMYLDNGTYCILTNGTVSSYGKSPILLFDLRKTSSSGFPSYTASGGIGPRQNAALDFANITVLPDSASFSLTGPSGVKDNMTSLMPDSYELKNIYPNPFNPSAVVEFNLPQNAFVTVTVSDLLGRTVRTIAQHEFGAGSHRLRFDGSSLPSGVYFICLRTNGRSFVKQARLIK